MNINPPNTEQPENRQETSFFQQIPRFLLGYVVISMIIQKFINPSPSQTSNELSIPSPHTNEVIIEKPSQFQTMMMGIDENANLPVFPIRDSAGRKYGAHRCLFHKGAELDLFLFVSESDEVDVNIEIPTWSVHGIFFDWNINDLKSHFINVTVTEAMLQGQLVYAHVYLARHNSPIGTKY